MALPTLRIIGFIIGIFLITLAVAMVVPMATLVIFERTMTCRRSSGRA
jgi:trk system potassium uptake protein TrkH